MLSGEPGDPGGAGDHPVLQMVEVQPAVDPDDRLPVGDAPGR
jgi:hypothetical protein